MKSVHQRDSVGHPFRHRFDCLPDLVLVLLVAKILPSGEVERLVRVVSLLEEAETPLLVLRQGLEQLGLED